MINRHEWLKAANKTDLLSRAKSMAVALWSFGNDETGLINPSLSSLCDASCLTEDTARRALADLEEAGWLARTVGRGKGVKSVYVLLSPGNVVALRSAQAPQKVAAKALETPAKRLHASKVMRAAKGSTGAAIRSQPCNPLYKDKQTFEQKKDARPSPHLSVLVPSGGWKALEWNKWLSEQRQPPLYLMKALHVEGGYCLPWAIPPTAHNATQKLIAMNIIEWAKEQSNALAA